jgi:hypothetical protein
MNERAFNSDPETAGAEFPDRVQRIIEVRDPELDGDALTKRLVEAIARRKSEGVYDTRLASRGPTALRPGRKPVAGDEAALEDRAGFPGLQEAMTDLIARAELREPEFASEAPLIAPIIVAIRRLWNWMSTKWYVRPILREQSQANARAAWVISDLMMWHELDADRIRQLEIQMSELEARLAELEGMGQG